MMKTYKVKFWNDSLKDYQKFEYPYLETALMMAEKFAKKLKIDIIITDGTLEGTLIRKVALN